MYSYFKGSVTEIYATHIVFEVANIGYRLRVPNPYQFKLNEASTVYLHYHVREDAQELFGFLTKDERDMFETLINVKGLGPKGALAIIATSTPNEIVNALNNNNSKFFVQFPGIGPKLSQQIVLDLKGKVNFDEDHKQSKTSEIINNVMVALKSLGYTSSEIKAATSSLDINEDTSLSEAVKLALKSLKKN